MHQLCCWQCLHRAGRSIRQWHVGISISETAAIVKHNQFRVSYPASSRLQSTSVADRHFVQSMSSLPWQQPQDSHRHMLYMGLQTAKLPVRQRWISWCA